MLFFFLKKRGWFCWSKWTSKRNTKGFGSTNKQQNAQNHCPFEVTKIISVNPNYSSTFVFTSGKQ